MLKNTMLTIGAGLVLIAGSWNGSAPETGLQDDGSYRVVDYSSHLDMCDAMTSTTLDHQACTLDAANTWK